MRQKDLQERYYLIIFLIQLDNTDVDLGILFLKQTFYRLLGREGLLQCVRMS